MPRGWQLRSSLAAVAFAAIFVPVTWLAVRGGRDVATRPPPLPRPQPSPDGTWVVDRDSSFARTVVFSVNHLDGEAVIVHRTVVRAQLRGGNARFDVETPVDLRALRRGRTSRVELSGRARLLFLSRRVHLPIDVLWIGNRLRLSGRSGPNELHLELRRRRAR